MISFVPGMSMFSQLLISNALLTQIADLTVVLSEVSASIFWEDGAEVVGCSDGVELGGVRFLY